MLIAGDIGGTKTDLAIFSSEAGPHAPLEQTKVRSSDCPNLQAIVKEFLAKERHGRRTSVNRCFSQRKCRRGAQEDHCAFHCFDTSSADMTELSEACTVLGA